VRGIWRRQSDRPKWRLEALIGLLMLPLSAVPIVLYLAKTDDGRLMYLTGRYRIAPPSTPALDTATARLAARHARIRVRGVPVLVYHGIGRGTGDSDDARFVVTRARFADQMRALEAAGYEPVTTRDLAFYLRTRQTTALPRKPVLITFDDGRTDAMVQADRILRDTGMRATMFVIGRAAGRSSFYYEDWGDLRRHVASGRWELGNHTADLHTIHDDVKGLPPVSALVRPGLDETRAAFGARIAADLDRAQQLLHDRGESDPVAFSYPFGDWGQNARVDWAAPVLRSVLRARFQLAFDQDGQSGWRFALPGDDPLHVHRLQVMSWTGAELLDRLAAAARLTETAFAERGLGLGYTDDELVAAAVDAPCVTLDRTPVRSGPATTKAVALTFDDGPSPYTPQVLDVLRAHGAHATFFVVGRNLAGREPLLQRMLVEGNEIGNKTWSERHAPAITRAGLDRELRLTSARIASIVPVRPCLTRPPYNEAVARHADAGAEAGMTTALWTVDPRDFELRSPDVIAERVLAGVRPGGIVVLRDGGSDRWATVQALPRILTTLARRGYRVVTVSHLVTGTFPPAPERTLATSTTGGTG
jgi:peptidoglycan/xylan/chitin deacetylase (PgdA/CDA1 family)